MILQYVLITIAAFSAMEFVAWFTHKYVMHGFFWFLHRDHHQPHDHTFERNDFFFMLFATPGIMLLYFGSLHSGLNSLFFVGLGITLYGACYFLVHDVFIHRRLKFFRNSDNRYLRAIRRAHKVHHKHLGKEDGESFGMLVVSWRYFRDA